MRTKILAGVVAAAVLFFGGFLVGTRASGIDALRKDYARIEADYSSSQAALSNAGIAAGRLSNELIRAAGITRNLISERDRAAELAGRLQAEAGRAGNYASNLGGGIDAAAGSARAIGSSLEQLERLAGVIPP